MKKILINSAIIIIMTLIVMLIISFIIWDIKWIASNEFFPVFGKMVALLLGIGCTATRSFNN